MSHQSLDGQPRWEWPHGPFGQNCLGGWGPDDSLPQADKGSLGKRGGCWIPFAAVLLLVVGAGGCVVLVGGVAGPADERPIEGLEITYRAWGPDFLASVAYTDSGGAMAQETHAVSPWEHKVVVTGSTSLFLVVANRDDANGDISCAIESEGTVISQDKRSGAGVSVSCAASSSDLRSK